jgi:hypothetical protein
VDVGRIESSVASAAALQAIQRALRIVIRIRRVDIDKPCAGPHLEVSEVIEDREIPLLVLHSITIVHRKEVDMAPIVVCIDRGSIR